jgi:hypothetical protein
VCELLAGGNLKHCLQQFDLALDKRRKKQERISTFCNNFTGTTYCPIERYSFIDLILVLINFNDANFRKNYRQLQALAYVPVEDVITGFNELNNNCVESFRPVLDYFYKTYIGDLKPGGKSRKGRFPITSWNVYNRVLAKRPKTNNNVESWHEKLNSKATKNLTINKLVELLREEQAKVEIDLVQINMGTVVKRKIKQQIKDDRLYYLCKNYDKSNFLEYLNNISLNFDIEKIKFKDYKEDE